MAATQMFPSLYMVAAVADLHVIEESTTEVELHSQHPSLSP